MTEHIEQSALSTIQIDALKEVSNIGAGHAATALSDMTGQKVLINIPVITIDSLATIFAKTARPGEQVVGVLINLMGDIHGRTLMLFAESEAFKFCESLLRKEPGAVRTLTDIERSCLNETSNILTCAYMNALGDLLGVMVVPSTPELLYDTAGAVERDVTTRTAAEREVVVSIKNEFTFIDKSIKLMGYFLLLPDHDSLRALFTAMHLQ
ncbi:MAG TPA: chemotaxis protein CheC [Candidatus Edwardsbacteria bacterium]|nr:chemotaxis protein CheC [Candidatus Edwardsbacteria bacterium]